MGSGGEQVREYAKKVLPTVGESVVFAIGGSLSCGFAYECSDVDIYAIAPDYCYDQIRNLTSPRFDFRVLGREAHFIAEREWKGTSPVFTRRRWKDSTNSCT